jgi:hypothetical protein
MKRNIFFILSFFGCVSSAMQQPVRDPRPELVPIVVLLNVFEAPVKERPIKPKKYSDIEAYKTKKRNQTVVPKKFHHP